MRRIIERVVTVVTTTTWTISWQGDPSQAVPVADNFPQSGVSDETAKHIQKFSSVITTKEADKSETEKAVDQSADEPPNHSYPKQSKKGNEKS